VEKLQGNPSIFAAIPYSPDLRKLAQTELKNSTVFEKIRENRIFLTQFFRVTRISHLPKIDITSMPERTIDAESLSNIAIHNFKKSGVIEIRILLQPKMVFSPTYLGLPSVRWPLYENLMIT